MSCANQAQNGYSQLTMNLNALRRHNNYCHNAVVRYQLHETWQLKKQQYVTKISKLFHDFVRFKCFMTKFNLNYWKIDLNKKFVF